MLLLLTLACAPAEPARVSLRPAGLDIQGEGIEAVTVRDPQGVPLLQERPPAPVDALSLRVRWPGPGAHAVELRSAAGLQTLSVEVPAELPPFELTLEAPVGQGQQAVSDGDEVSVLLVDGQPTPVAATMTAWAAGEASLSLGERETSKTLRLGERLRLSAILDTDKPLHATLNDTSWDVSLVSAPVASAQLAEQLRLREVAFPADRLGALDVGRPEGRVSLPAAWWRQLQRLTGLGFRGRDPWAPWAFWGVEVENRGDEPVNLVVRVQVLDEDGQPAPAFRPLLREGDDGSSSVRVLLRVPAGGVATAPLPLFVDEAMLSADDAAERRWTRRVDLLPLGAPAAIAAQEAPLYVSRGSLAASLGVGLALLSAALGCGLLALRGGRWLREAATSELMTISLFGALTFLVGTAGQLLSMGVSAVLGPFAILLTGLIDDTLRYALLATLLTLLPRVGTASLAIVTAWLLSGVALGSFAPTDLLYLGSRVLFLEGALWVAGVTRSEAWLDQGRAWRWARLSFGFGVASALSTAAGLTLHMALYRLYYADWYAAMLIAGPGFLYECLACAVAVPFAESLRGIQR